MAFIKNGLLALFAVASFMLVINHKRSIKESSYSLLYLIILAILVTNNFLGQLLPVHLYDYLIVSQTIGFKLNIVIALALVIREAINIDQKLQDYELEIETQKQLSVAKNQFLSMVSHELRTPLNAILGYSNLLVQEPLEPRYIQNIESIKDSGVQLLGIVNNILDYSKLKSGELKLHLNEFAPKNELLQIVNTASSIARSRGLKFESSLPDNLPPKIVGDQHRLFQMINNILDNALKFTQKGTIKLSIKYTKTGPHVCALDCLNEDEGIGISKSKLQ